VASSEFIGLRKPIGVYPDAPYTKLLQETSMTTTTESILGTWFIAGLNVVGDEDGILVILPDGRAVQFQSSITPPRMNQTMHFWYSRPDEGSIRFRMSPDADGWLRFIKITPEGWSLVSDDDRGRHEFPCRRTQPLELPNWYSDMMEKSLEIMATLETK